MSDPGMSYGQELILDIHNCDSSLFTREDLETFVKRLCDLIGMEREEIYFWDYDDMVKHTLPVHLKGTSVVQFIRTSNIVIHALDDLNKVFLNIFSCREFDIEEASTFSRIWLKGEIHKRTIITRE